MNTINQTILKVTEEICLKYLIKVDDSTGSYHDKQDVKNLIVRIVDEIKVELTIDLHDVNVAPQSTDERLYTRDMVVKAWEDVDMDDHVSVDLDSAEFSIGYSNRLELDSANVEINYDDITDEFTSALDKAYEQSINNTNQ